MYHGFIRRTLTSTKFQKFCAKQTLIKFKTKHKIQPNQYLESFSQALVHTYRMLCQNQTYLPNPNSCHHCFFYILYWHTVTYKLQLLLYKLGNNGNCINFSLIREFIHPRNFELPSNGKEKLHLFWRILNLEYTVTHLQLPRGIEDNQNYLTSLDLCHVVIFVGFDTLVKHEFTRDGNTAEVSPLPFVSLFMIFLYQLLSKASFLDCCLLVVLSQIHTPFFFCLVSPNAPHFFHTTHICLSVVPREAILSILGTTGLKTLIHKALEACFGWYA